MHIKLSKLSLLIAAPLALGTLPALAADAIVAAPSPIVAAPEPISTWEGGYVGAFAGWAGLDSSWDDLDNEWWNGERSASSDGFTGGVYVGYNWQNGNFVYGLEADIGGASNDSVSNFSNGTYDDREHNSLNWLSTFRGRLGVSHNNLLFFATGGVAVGGFDNHMTSKDYPSYTYDGDDTHWGWVAGGGIEAKINENWSVRFEGLYHDFSGDTFRSDEGDDMNISNSVTTARFGVGYHF